MKTPPLSQSIAHTSNPGAPAFEEAGGSNGPEAATAICLVDGRHMAVGQGMIREHLNEGAGQANDSSPMLDARVVEGLETRIATDPGVDTKPAFASLQAEWDQRIQHLESQVAAFTGAAEAKASLTQQLRILGEMGRTIISGPANSANETWANRALSDFEDVVQNFGNRRLPVLRTSKYPEYSEGKSIIKYEFNKFANYSSWMAPNFDYLPEEDPKYNAHFNFDFEKRGFSWQKLDKYLNELALSLKKGIQTAAFAVDRLLLSDLVDLENRTYPGINLRHVRDASDFVPLLKQQFELMPVSTESFRFLVGTGEGPSQIFLDASKYAGKFYLNEQMVHYCAFDVLRVNGGISIIALEPALLDCMPSMVLRDKVVRALSIEFPEAKISFIELHTQKSDGECHIYSLSNLRKMFSQKEAMRSLHMEHLEGRFATYSAEKLRNLLPVQFMKHAQSRRRIEDYLKQNPSASEIVVNKKQETLLQRYDRHVKELTTQGGVTVRSSDSIERKRLAIMSNFAETARPAADE